MYSIRIPISGQAGSIATSGGVGGRRRRGFWRIRWPFEKTIFYYYTYT